MRANVLLLAAACWLAACVGPGAPTPTPSATPDIAWPKVDAAKTLADLRTFSDLFPGRQFETKTHVESRAWLAAHLQASGLEVVRQRFPVAVSGPNGAYSGENIIGIKWGADRTQWIVVGAHYDVTELAAQGTYDDGSGTVQTLALARAFAKEPTDRTLAFVLFDQEERGLIGSAYFVKSIRESTFPHRAEFVAMIDLDMVGITHPHPAPLVCQENSDELRALAETARKDAAVPDAKMQYRAPRGGTSDAASFFRINVPTIYCWSNWDEVVLKDGTKVQGSYPWWHRADTYATMLAMAGDEATLRGGFQTVLDIISPVVAAAAANQTVLDTRA